MLVQSGWLHAVRARIAAPSNDTPTCLDSTSKGKVIDFFVVSEELHPVVRTVMVDERPTVTRTQRSVVPTLEGVKRGRLVQRLRKPARLPRIESYAELHEMLNECEQREDSDAVVRATLGGAALQWGRTVETEVLGRYDLVHECKHPDKVTVCITRQQQLVVRRGPGPACEAAPWNLARSGTVICNVHRRYLQLALTFLRTTSPQCGAQAEKPVAMDRREATGGAANLRAGGWSD